MRRKIPQIHGMVGKLRYSSTKLMRLSMRMRQILYSAGLSLAILLTPVYARAQLTNDAPVVGRPVAIVNLATEDGVKLVKGQWRYHDVQIVTVDHHSVGPDLRPSGLPNRT